VEKKIVGILTKMGHAIGDWFNPHYPFSIPILLHSHNNNNNNNNNLILWQLQALE